MAGRGFITQEGNILGATATTINLTTLAGWRPKSAVIANDDNAGVITVVVNSQTFTVRPNEVRVLTGIEYYTSLSLTSTVNPTAFRFGASSDSSPPTIDKLNTLPAGYLSASATGRAIMADDYFDATMVSASGAGGKFEADCITAAGLIHLIADNAFTTANALALFDTDSIQNAFLLKAIQDGAFAAADTSRALFAASFLGNSATGRALMQDGYFDLATLLAKVANDAIDNTFVQAKFAAGAFGTDADSRAAFAARIFGGEKINLTASSAPAADAVASGAGAVDTAFATIGTIAAGRLLTGSRIKLRAWGTVTAGGGAVNLQLTARVDTVTIGAQTTAVDPATNATFLMDAEAIIASTGVAGTFNGMSQSSVATQNDRAVNVGAPIDTTVARNVNLLVSWAAGAGESVRLDGFHVEVLN